MLSPEQLETLRRAPLNGPNKLALAMVLQGINQEAVAEGAGISQGTISKLKNGRYLEFLKSQAALAAFFGCDIADLFPSRQQPSIDPIHTGEVTAR